jgi:hypothetical protein
MRAPRSTSVRLLALVCIVATGATIACGADNSESTAADSEGSVPGAIATSGATGLDDTLHDAGSMENVSRVDACAWLTPDEIKNATNEAPTNNLESSTPGMHIQCVWDFGRGQSLFGNLVVSSSIGKDSVAFFETHQQDPNVVVSAQIDDLGRSAHCWHSTVPVFASPEQEEITVNEVWVAASDQELFAVGGTFDCSVLEDLARTAMPRSQS